MAVIEGILTVALNVPLSALGMSMRTNVANRPAELRLPGPPLREDGSGLQGGELTPPAFQHIQDGDQLRTWMDDDAPPGWGKVHMRWPGGGAAAIWRCALAVEDAGPFQPQEIAEAVFGAVGTWWFVALDWLEIAFNQPLDAGDRATERTAINPCLWTHDGSKVVLLNDELHASSWGGPEVDAAALHKVLRLAGHLVRPELAWQLIRDARRQQLLNEHRRAVVDAGTAAEVALQRLLQHHGNATSGEETLGQLVSRTNEIPVLTDLSAPADLVNVRNDAIHRAVTPKQQDVVRAIQISRQYVDWTWPRASLLSEATDQRTTQQNY
jgi:hypothetical protein